MEAAQAALEAKAKEKVLLIHDLQLREFGLFKDIDFGSDTSFGGLARGMGGNYFICELSLSCVYLMCIYFIEMYL